MTPVARRVTDGTGVLFAVVDAIVDMDVDVDVDAIVDGDVGAGRAPMGGGGGPLASPEHPAATAAATATVTTPARTFGTLGGERGPGWDRTSDRRIMSPLL